MNSSLLTWPTLAVFLCSTAEVHADSAPAQLTEQGRLYDADGTPLQETVTLTFSIYDLPEGGTTIWEESSKVDLVDGYFSIPLGETVPFGGGLWNGSVRYIGLKVNDDEEMRPREAVRSVPYALTATDAIGDIHPTSVSVNGNTVINSAGQWVGPTLGLKGDKGDIGPSGITHKWQGYLPGPVGPNTEDSGSGSGPLAHMTVRAPDNGYMTVRADFLNAVRNRFEEMEKYDCVVTSQLASTAGAARAGLGMAQIIVNGLLPTQNPPEKYQGFLMTAERSFPVTEGQQLTVYLNGDVSPLCKSVIWLYIQMTAEFTKNFMEVQIMPN